MAELEHVNVTVSDGARAAAWMGRIFDWHIRWQGSAMNGAGATWHVGTKTGYVALYQPAALDGRSDNTYATVNGLNHIAVTVDDLDATEAKVRAEGFDLGQHYDYEPGRRFYFYDDDGIEYEVVSYS